MSITVIKPGMLTSVQDLGRYGYQHLGVPVSGAIDTRAHRLANFLAGNTDDTATLEITLTGPTLRFNTATCVAISGALLSPSINNNPIPNNRPIIVNAGDTLKFGQHESGLRAYLAVYGGFKIQPVMGSSSTYIRGGFGGFNGRALVKNDQISLNSPLTQHNLAALNQALWQIQIYLPAILNSRPRTDIRAVSGVHAELFTPESIQTFFNSAYTVDAQSERMGYRLKGPTLNLSSSKQILSEAISFGTIQVPPDGSPIILMADRQTTGGYAKIAQICSADLTFVAQTMPGQELRFHLISLAEAQQLDNQRKEAFGRFFQSLAVLREALNNYKNNS